MRFDALSLRRALQKPSTAPGLRGRDRDECIVRLPVSRAASPFIEATMKYDETCCSRLALSMYLGETVTEEVPDVAAMCAVARARGEQLRVLHHCRRLPVRHAVYATVRRTPRCESGAYAKAIPVGRAADRSAGISHIANIARRVPADCHVVIAVLFSTLHPEGHCVVVRETEDGFCIGDPFLPACTAARVPTTGLAWMLLAGANIILG